MLFNSTPEEMHAYDRAKRKYPYSVLKYNKPISWHPYCVSRHPYCNYDCIYSSK